MSTITEPSHRQRDDALFNAERVRLQRARLRGEIRRQANPEARGILADVIETMPEWLETIDVAKLIEFGPRVGPGATEHLLEVAEIHTRRRLVELSDRQRRVLASQLRSIGR